MRIRISEQRKNEIRGLILLSLAILILLSFLSYDRNNVADNYAGRVGHYLGGFLYGLLGWGAYLVPLILGIWGFNSFRGKRLGNLLLKLIGVLVFLVAFCAFAFVQGEKGGLLGKWTAFVLSRFFGRMGGFVILGTLLFIALLLTTEFLFFPFLQRIRELRKSRRKGGPSPKEKPLVSRKKERKEEKRKPPTREREREEVSTRYQFPSLSLLDMVPYRGKESEEMVEQTSRLLEKTLKDFEIEAKILRTDSGPVITRFEVQPAAGVKVSTILSLSNDIALALAVPGVRLEAPIPGKAAIGIEIPKKKSNMHVVCLKEVLESDEFQESESPLVFGLGKDIAGQPVITDLKDLPHLLIAGATGSGKSVCVNSLITSILFKAEAERVKFLMVDPKMVELKPFAGIPHLVTPVITDSKKATLALKWLVREMERRYREFSEAGVRDIEGYNRTISTSSTKSGEGEDKDSSILPYIVVVIDELADLMLVAPQDCESLLIRLAQMSRAVGIHLILVTQRPSVDVVTGLIKANFPSRISFQVSARVDSRTVLDMGGAEKLVGKGDMLFLPAGETKPQRVQGSFVSEKEIEKVGDFLRKQKEPVYEEGIYKVKKDVQVDREAEELFEEAVEFAIQAKRVSISLLQRRFRIGYNRAARLIDMLEDKAVIGPYQGAKPRQVLVGEDYLRRNK